jgi:hypothetical protein
MVGSGSRILKTRTNKLYTVWTESETKRKYETYNIK